MEISKDSKKYKILCEYVEYMLRRNLPIKQKYLDIVESNLPEIIKNSNK